MQKVLVFTLLALLVASSNAAFSDAEIESLFGSYIQRYNKSYTADTAGQRFQNFKDNLNFVMDFNARTNETFKVAINEYSDMTPDEFIKNKGGFLMPENATFATGEDLNKLLGNKTVEDSLDWRDQNVVTPVINQGNCGSCWTWSSNGALESAWAIQHKQLYQLSAQQLLDCAGSYGNYGCSGGFMDGTYRFIIANGGVCKASDYPYVGRQTRCQKRCKPVVRMTSFVNIKNGDEEGLMKALNLGPVAVAVMANSRAIMQYRSGIISSNCGRRLDHAIVLVGYGEEKGTPYWTLKNSWGQGWGEKGYFRIVRGKNMCGVADMASLPIVPKLTNDTDDANSTLPTNSTLPSNASLPTNSSRDNATAEPGPTGPSSSFLPSQPVEDKPEQPSRAEDRPGQPRRRAMFPGMAPRSQPGRPQDRPAEGESARPVQPTQPSSSSSSSDASRPYVPPAEAADRPAAAADLPTAAPAPVAKGKSSSVGSYRFRTLRRFFFL